MHVSSTPGSWEMLMRNVVSGPIVWEGLRRPEHFCSTGGVLAAVLQSTGIEKHWCLCLGGRGERELRESGTAGKHLETRASLEGLVLHYFMRVKITKESPKEWHLWHMQALSLCGTVLLSRQLISPSPTFWWAGERKKDMSETFVSELQKSSWQERRSCID